jgi:hypothetical protein
MDDDRKLVDGVISNYFKSVKESFEYYLGKEWKEIISSILVALSALFMMLNIMPIFPGANKETYLVFCFNFLENEFGILLDKYNFYYKWLVGAIFSGLIFAILFIIQKIIEKKFEEKSIQYKELNFCYSYSAREGLKNFLANERKVLLEKSKKYFKNVIRQFDHINFPYRREVVTLKAVEIEDLFNRRLKWFQLSESTQEILKAIKDSKNKIIDRLDAGKEIDKLIPIFDFLILFEFSVLKPDTLNTQSERMGEHSTDYIKAFAKSVNNLSKVKEIIQTDERVKLSLREIWILMNKILNNENIIVLILSWLIVLSLFFSLISILMINIFGVSFDSTIIAGIFTAAFLGAVTVSVSIYSKQLKK